MGSNLVIPLGCDIVNASGDYIFPGFIDAHNHIGLEEEIYGTVGSDVNETSHPVTPELQAVDGINFADLAFEDALRGGVTSSLCMPGSANIIGGQAVLVQHLADHMSNMIHKKPWGLKAALGENPKKVYAQEKKAPVTRMANASLLRESLYNAGKSVDKDSNDLRSDYKDRPLRMVLRKEMPLLLHAHRADDILTALRIKDEFNIDMIIQHGTEAFLVADELVKRDVPVFYGPLIVNRAKVEMKAVRLSNVSLLADRGVNFSLITDHPVVPIEHLRVCAALAVREGLDEQKAIASITSSPAQILKVGDEIGSLKEGKRADLTVFDGHPFDFRTRVKMTMVNGILWFNQEYRSFKKEEEV